MVKGRVLVVDDQKAQADAMVDILRFEGHEADAAYSVDEALEKVGPDTHVVATDLHIGDGCGYDLTRRLREKDFGPQVCVVSATQSSGWELKAREHGAYATLAKPIRVNDFLPIVAQGIALKRAQETRYS